MSTHKQELKILVKSLGSLFLLVFWLVLSGYTVVNAATEDAATEDAATEDVPQLTRFTIRGFIMDDGQINPIIDFYYWEDMSGYLGTMMLDKGNSGEWYIDEIVDVSPYADLSEQEIIEGIAYIGYELTILLNNDMNWSYVFPEWQPESLYNLNHHNTQTNREWLRAVYDNEFLANYQLFLPLVVKP